MVKDRSHKSSLIMYTTIFIICINIIFVQIPSIAEATTPPDVIGTIWQEPVGYLAELGIISGFPDGSYRPDEPVTRSAFSKISVIMLGFGDIAESKKGTTSFKDVPTSHWATGFISTASSLSLIKGGTDGRFRPDDKVSYAEALTILLRALGYGPSIEASGKWPDNYLAKADELRLIKDVIWSKASDPASRGNVARLAWNALNLPEVGETFTLLETIYPDFAYEHRTEKTIEEIAKLAASTVFIRTYDSYDKSQEVASGSGVIMGKGILLTNFHVIDGSPRFGIVYDNTLKGQEYNLSTILYFDYNKDIAIIDSPDRSVLPVKTGDSSKLVKGQKVVAIGSPNGIDYINSISQGIISGFREINGIKYIQTDAAISQGSSGGGLFNMYGELIGITSMKDFGGESLNIALPINTVLEAMNSNKPVDLVLNNSLFNEMRTFTYDGKSFFFDFRPVIYKDSGVFAANYYIYDAAEGSSNFISLFNTQPFRDFIDTKLEGVHKLLMDNGYKDFIINLTVEDRNYTYKIKNSVRTLLKETFLTPPPQVNSYEALKQELLISFSNIQVGSAYISNNDIQVFDSGYDTSKLLVVLYMNQNSYNNVVTKVKNDLSFKTAYEEAIAKIGQNLSQKYPSRNVEVGVVLDDASYSKPVGIPEEYFYFDTTDNKWYVTMVFATASNILGEDYIFDWVK